MSSIRVSGNTSGHYDLTVPDVAGSNTIALDKIVVADSNGFVGIGTTTAYSASTDFEVKATDPKIVIHNTGQRAFGLLASGTKLHIRDESDNQDLVTITEGGNVGIGTASPEADLQIATSSNAAAGGAKLLLKPNGAYGTIVNNDDLGQIAFGAKTASIDNTDNDSVMIRGVADGTWASADYPTRLEFWTTTDGAANPTERMRIDSSGNVGIGTSTPSSPKFSSGASGVLELKGSKPSFNIQESDVTDAHFNMSMSNGSAYLAATGTGNLVFATGTANWSEKMRIDSSGNVGIGTASPDEKLDVRGHIKMTNSYLKVRRNVTYDQAWDIGITHASASQHGSLFIYPPSSQTVQSTSGVVIGTGNTGSNYPFILNGDGILSLDHQPSANVYVNGGNAGAYNNTATNSVIVAAGIRHNIGSHYNSSNGRFTCPISGRYFVSFSANWYNNSAGTWIRPQIKKNGATVTQHYENTANNPVWMHIGASTIIDCSQGDYLEIYNQTQSGAGGGMDTGAYSNINFHKIA